MSNDDINDESPFTTDELRSFDALSVGAVSLLANGHRQSVATLNAAQAAQAAATIELWETIHHRLMNLYAFDQQHRLQVLRGANAGVDVRRRLRFLRMPKWETHCFEPKKPSLQLAGQVQVGPAPAVSRGGPAPAVSREKPPRLQPLEGLAQFQQRDDKCYLRLPAGVVPTELVASTRQKAFVFHKVPGAPFAHRPLNNVPHGLYRVVGFDLDTAMREGAELRLHVERNGRPLVTSAVTLLAPVDRPTDTDTPLPLVPTRATEQEKFSSAWRSLIRLYETGQPFGSALKHLLKSCPGYLGPSHATYIREMLAEARREETWSAEGLDALREGAGIVDNAFVEVHRFLPKTD
jgi:hypothetical protein